ncbi:hypothetical protein [Peribacillus huizhouensis]|uniref:Na+/H+ antiporter NhaC n=1 Tax=Peribacillus huizhouensis TaxID=1501239 RepID=A0ABR6CWL5_9BACI|nr:hypothetical protein [Peribacillus huizhouensis]MBA9029306.1 Na+/H+ antiporter NhaC [Peribacillus huizhouensis]
MKQFVIDFFILFIGIIVIGIIFEPSDLPFQGIVRKEAFDLDFNGIARAIVISLIYSLIGTFIRRIFSKK